MIYACVVNMVMAEVGKLFLEGQDSVDFLGYAGDINLCIIKVCVDERLLLGLECLVRNIKLFLRVFASLGLEEAQKNIAVSDCFVVFFL